ncbi:MAG: sigma factor-like helix-turn-helix DNA-binding protein [Prochloraceae cyanobacterium]
MPKSFFQIGHLLGRSRERIRQIHKNAIDRRSTKMQTAIGIPCGNILLK